MKKNKLTIFFGIFLLFFFLIVFKNVQAVTAPIASSSPTDASSLDLSNQASSTNFIKNSDSSDAIAVRIVPNPDHFNISRWYENQGFAGSPQALTVDGYDAIRDGRTVYVAAANISGKFIFTNIYLISYNQNPDVTTVDILGQIIKNWKFNTDLVEKTNPAPSCSISSVSCSSTTDCGQDQICASSGIASSSCQLVTGKNCSNDADCPQSFFCNSVKAKITRDIKRISENQELTFALSRYKDANGSYPKLQAGTYISGYTISAWPSWSETFLSTLGMTQSFVDPINRLGACANFESKTCWNSATQKFVYSPSNNTLMLPAGSYGFVYNTDSQGSSYNLCSVMETREATADLNFQFSPAVAANSNCVSAIGVSVNGLVTNTAPRVVSSYLSGEANQEFNGSVNVVDDQNNPITWSLKSSANYSTWSGKLAPVLKDTNNPNQKKVYSLASGIPGIYPISLILSDGQGGNSTTTLPITITNPKPSIEADNAEYILNPGTPFKYNFYFASNNLTPLYQTAYSISTTSPLNSDLDLLKRIPSNAISAGINRYQVSYSGLVPTSTKFYSDTDYFYRVTVKDKYNTTATKDFKITLKVENPILNFSCQNEQRINKNYSCTLGPLQNNNHQLTYSSSNLPATLKINTDGTSAVLSGAVANVLSSLNSYDIKVTNEYGASTTKKLFLKVNTYCGDGIRQLTQPNTEGRGGIYNDGYEDCDGKDGVTANVASSSINLQYACATFSSDTPYPIVNNNYCVYNSPVATVNPGGFCGDGYCQTQIEDIKNCPVDCISVRIPDCTNKDCGSDGAGGICGKCPIGDDCFAGKCCSKEATVKVLNDGNGATIEAYFNGNKIDKAKLSSYDGSVLHGKNVLAIKADLNGVSIGYDKAIIATIDQVSQTFGADGKSPKNVCRAVTTSNLKNWKCDPIQVVNTSGQEWYALDYDDSTWSIPNSGISSPYLNIWAKDWVSTAPRPYTRLITAYCRYTFTGDTLDNEVATPDCADKECGPNGAGGNCRPDSCPATNKNNNNFTCDNNVGKCACAPLSCDSINNDKGIARGTEGSSCGIIDNTCNDTIDCGDSCNAGLYCKLDSGQYGYNASSAFNICNPGKQTNRCQKKCWWLPTVATKSVTFLEGDTLESTTCAIKKSNDNPQCGTPTNSSCPSECQTLNSVPGTIINDSCFNCSWNLGICFKSWRARKIYNCSNSVQALLYLGDKCNASAGSQVQPDASCKCVPMCSGNNCGDDGCGGFCLCSNGNRCDTSAGTCTIPPECIPQCNGKTCGQDGCNGYCGTCSGATPVCSATGQCVVAPQCTSWTYSSWSTCINGTQNRTIISSLPDSCVGGSPVLSQACASSGRCNVQSDCTNGLTCKSMLGAPTYGYGNATYSCGATAWSSCGYNRIPGINCISISQSDINFSRCATECENFKGVTINGSKTGLCSWWVENGWCK